MIIMESFMSGGGCGHFARRSSERTSLGEASGELRPGEPLALSCTQQTLKKRTQHKPKSAQKTNQTSNRSFFT